MTKQKRAPIESYGAEMFNALIEGSRKTFHVTLPYRDAVKFRLRCYQLRNRMLTENHELYPVAAKTKISLSWDETKIPTKLGYRNSKTPIDSKAPVTLTIGPQDSEYADALKAAGLTATPIPQSTLPDGKSPPSLDTLLKDWDK
jgi:hypothetical protein